MDLSRKTVCFVDNGLFTAFARKVAPAFGRALYWMPWQGAFPKSRQLVVGEGFPEMERVKSTIRYRDDGLEASRSAWYKLKESVDLWVFLDVFHADLQWELIEEGRRVWGARDAEELELYRWEARQVWKRLGLPVLPAELIVGLPKLRSYLQQHENKFVKQSFTRGDFETFHHRTFQQSERRLEQMEYDLGPIKEDYEFIVEEEFPDAVEFGWDGAVVDARFLYPALLAPEVKGLGMVARLVASPAELPPALRTVNEKLAPEFGRLGYRGPFSSEVRYGKDQVGILQDPCCRLGSPSNELVQEMLGYWPRVMWEGAAGVAVAPKPLWKYGAVVMAYAEDSGQNWQELFYPPKLDNWVKVRNALRMGARNYAVPQGAPQNLAGVVGVGNTLLEAIASGAERAKQVKGDRLDLALPALEQAVEILRQAEKFGTKFGGPLPSAEELRKAVAG